MTSREAAIRQRRQRAREEGLVARLVGGVPFYGRYRVGGGSGREHEVRFRWTRGAVHRCDCKDYETNGLGTCKHVEAVWLHLESSLSPQALEEQARRAAEPSWRGAVLDRRAVFLDLETRRLFQEVGGRHHLDRLGVSVAVTYSEADGGFRSYREEQVPSLIERLLSAPLVVGFNLLRFDYEVLAGYSAEAERLYAVPTLDLMLELEERLGWRPGLDGLAEATLGMAKGGTGLDAVRYFREGRIDELERYCRQDVELTRLLFEFGLREGFLVASDREGRPVRVAVPWHGGLAA
ncbi:MAG TPA: hypothetical protein VIK90_00150 [Limnochordales bacterium]